MKKGVVFILCLSLWVSACRGRESTSSPKIYEDIRYEGGESYIDDTGRLEFASQHLNFRLSIRCAQKPDGSDARTPDDPKIAPAKGHVFVLMITHASPEKVRHEWMGRGDREKVFAKISENLTKNKWKQSEVDRYFEIICAKDIPQTEESVLKSLPEPYKYEESQVADEVRESRDGRKKVRLSEADTLKLDQVAQYIYAIVKKDGEELPGKFREIFY